MELKLIVKIKKMVLPQNETKPLGFICLYYLFRMSFLDSSDDKKVSNRKRDLRTRSNLEGTSGLLCTNYL